MSRRPLLSVLRIRELPNQPVNQVNGRRFHRNPAHKSSSFALTASLRGVLALRVGSFRFCREHLSSVRDKGALPSATQPRSVHAGHKCNLALYTSIIPKVRVHTVEGTLVLISRDSLSIFRKRLKNDSQFADYHPVLSTMSTSLKHGEQISSALRLPSAGARFYRASLLRVPPPPPLLLRLFFFSHHSWAFHNHLTTRAQRRGKLEWPTCSIKLSIFLIHNRPGTTRPTGPADWCWGCQTFASNPKENTRARATSGCQSAATGEGIRFGINVTAAIVLQQVLIMAKILICA